MEKRLKKLAHDIQGLPKALKQSLQVWEFPPRHAVVSFKLSVLEVRGVRGVRGRGHRGVAVLALGARVPDVRVEVEAVLEPEQTEGTAVRGLLATLHALVAAKRVSPAVRLAAVRTDESLAGALRSTARPQPRPRQPLR